MLQTARRPIRCFFIAILVGHCSAEAAEIRLKPVADVRGSLVLLGDIAEITGSPPALLESLRRIELFPAPARGRVREMRDVELRQLLQLHGLNGAEHRFSGAESIRISHAPTKSPASASLPVASGEGNAVVVLKRAIASGELIRAVDVELKVPDRPQGNVAAATGADRVVGQEATRALAAGQPVDVRALRKPLLIRKGEPVLVVSKAPGVRVRTTGKALSDAARGDLVQIESPGNRATIFAEVTGLREATIFASGAVVTAPPPAETTRSGVPR